MPEQIPRKECLVLALVQCESIDSDPALAQAKMDEICAQAKCDLIIFPEMYMSGYSISPESLQKLAEPADGLYARQIASLAQKYQINIIYGYPERVNDTVYNSAQLISATGKTILNYRKTHLFGNYDQSCFAPGRATPGIAAIEGWNIAIQICYDIEFPENARIAALAGADIIAVPTANMLPFQTVSNILVPARSLENQVYIGYANYCGSTTNLDFCGNSIITAPSGDIIAHERGFTAIDATVIYGHCLSSILDESRSQYTYLHDRLPTHYSPLISEKPSY